jgi:hypothetical protein
MALLGVQTYPGWFVAAFSVLITAWGVVVILKAPYLIRELHRGEESSPITRWALQEMWWFSNPFLMRVFGGCLAVAGLYLLYLVLRGRLV